MINAFPRDKNYASNPKPCSDKIRTVIYIHLHHTHTHTHSHSHTHTYIHTQWDSIGTSKKEVDVRLSYFMHRQQLITTSSPLQKVNKFKNSHSNTIHIIYNSRQQNIFGCTLPLTPSLPVVFCTLDSQKRPFKPSLQNILISWSSAFLTFRHN